MDKDLLELLNKVYSDYKHRVKYAPIYAVIIVVAVFLLLRLILP